MRLGRANVLVLLLLFLSLFFQVYGRDCSYYCKCYMWNGLKRADCINQRLVNIETETSTHVEAFDLSNNYITSVDDYGFQNLGLVEIRYLNFQNNKISSVGLYAFASLKRLQIVDLSNNYLQYLHPKTFEENLALQTLNLSKNKLGIILNGPFLDVSTLRDLDVSKCQFGKIDVDMFSQLPSLKRLNLSSNHLIKLDVKALEVLSNLREVDVSLNAWPCDDDTRMLQHWFQKRGIPDTTSCETQEKLAKMIVLPDENRTSNEEIEDNLWFEVDEIDRGHKVEDEETTALVDTGFFAMMDRIPSVWALVIGFEVGVMLSVFGMYIWLQGPRVLKGNLRHYRRPGSFVTTRASQNSDIVWTELETANCPETPPPPYRFVRDSLS